MRKISVLLFFFAAMFHVHDASAGAIKYRNTPGDMSWVNGRVPYTFNNDVSEEKRKVFDAAARAWQRVANLNFVRTTEYGFHQSADGDYILVQTNSLGEGWNYSWIGRSGPSGYPFTGMQPLSINVWEQGLITHEVGHSLGFIHEQQRTDRNEWVQLDWGQINGFTAVNWDIEPHSVIRSAYDYFSIMHYWSGIYRDFWKTGNCMVATQGHTLPDGEVLSAEDVTARMGGKIENPKYPNDLYSTNLLSDGDREAIIGEYGTSSRVSGYVIAANGKLLEGATVTLEGLGEAANVIRLMKTAKEDRVRTAANGTFTFIGLPNGQYKVKISKTGFTFNPSEFAVTAVSAGAAVQSYVANFVGTNIDDTVPPTVAFTKPAPEPRNHYANFPAVSGTVVDTGGAEIRDVRIAISNGAGQWLNFSSGDFDPLGTTFNFTEHGPLATITGENWSHAVPHLAEEGAYTAYVLAGDFSSNISEWESTGFVIDRTLPAATVEGIGEAGSFFDFEKLGGIATDAGTPDLKVTFTIVESASSSNRYWTGSEWTLNSFDPRTKLVGTVTNGRWSSRPALPSRGQLAEGSFSVRMEAEDAAGHVQIASSGFFTRSPLDTTVPEVAIEEPVHEVVYGERAMPVLSGTASDDGSPIQGVRVYLMRQLPGGVYKYWSLDTDVDQTLEPLMRYKWSDTVAHVEADYDEENGTWAAPREGFRLPAGDELPDGTYRVQAMAFNRESPQGTRSVEHIFRIGLEPPTVTVTSPSQNGFVKAGWDISGTVTDPSGTGFFNDRVTLTLNWNGSYWNGDSWVEGQVELYATIAEDGTWTYPAGSLPVEEGEFAISVSVKDNNGISSMPTSGGNQLIFRVDRTPPEVVISAPGDNEVITVLPSAGAWFYGTASDAYPTQPGVSLYLMRVGINGGADTYWTGSGWTQNMAEGELMAEYLTSGGPEWEPPLALPRLGLDEWHCLSDGAYAFMAVARDAAGNETQRQVGITIDTSITFPALTPSEPQDIPLTPEAVTATERLTFAPVPGDERNQGVSFIGRDLSGNVYSGMSLYFPSSSSSSSAVVKHGVAAANPGGMTELWRKERQLQITNYTSGDTTIQQYWERWSDAENWQEISLENFSNPHLSIGDLVVDGAGNVFAAFNVLANGSYAITNYPYWREGLLRSNTTYIVKWDTNGVVQGRWTFGGSHSSSNVIEMELLNDGSVAVLVDNYYDGRHTINSYPYRHMTIVARVGSAAGDFFSATALGVHSRAGALEIDAADNVYVLSAEAEGDSYYATEHVLEKLSPEGDLLRRVMVCYCDAPEGWNQMKVDRVTGDVYVAGSLMVAEEDGVRMAITKFNLQNVENSEQVWRVFSPPRTTGSWGEVVLSLDDEGVTAGATGYATTFSNSDYYISVARFTKEGEFEWCRTNADPSIAYAASYSGDGLSLADLTTDAEGNVYIVGWGFQYGLIKLAANGDLQFIKPFPEDNYFAQYGGHHESRLWLSPEGSIETLVHNSQSEYAILSFSNPAVVLIPVAIPAGGEPLDQSVASGAQALFTVSNTGSPAHYQWYREDANGNPQPIEGANTSSLLIPQVQAADAGRYSVVLTGKDDPSDSVTSRTATLTVYEVVPMADALDFAGLTWTNGGQGEWFGHTGVSHDGVDSATVVLGAYEDAWMETTLSGPGTLSFWWQKPYGFSEDLRLLLNPNETSDGTVLAIAEPNGGWSHQVVTIPEGTHTVRFQFDAGFTPGVRALVDEVNYVRGSQPAVVTVESPGADSTVFALPSVSGSAADVIETVTFSMQRAEDGKFWDGMSWIDELVELSTDYNRVAGTWTSDELLPAPGSDSATTLLDGQYYFTAYGRNSVGDFVNHMVYVQIYANAALGISLTTPADGDTLSELSYLRGETTARTERVEVTIERLSDGMFWDRTDWQVATQVLPANYFRDGGVWSYTEVPDFEEGSYRLTATAYDAEENSAQVVATVEIAAASLPEVTALTIDPATADVTSAGTTLGVTLQAAGPAPISFGVVTLTSPSGANTVDAYFSSWDLVNDAFQIQLNLSRYLEPGTWTVSVYLQDENNVSASYGPNSSPLPDGATAEVQIANTGPVDQTPPELVSLQMAPSSVDVTGAGADVTVTAHLRDDVGVQSGSFALRSPGGKTIYGYFSAANRISGTVADGIYQTVLQIPAHAEPGTWIPSLDISDMAGNSRYSVSLPEGSTTGLLVVNSGPVDSTPPALESLTIQPTSVDVTNGAQTVTVTLQATDDVGGLSAGWFSLISPDGWHHAYQNFDQTALTSGTPQAGTYQFTVTVPRFVVPGVWKAELQLRDASGNSVNFGTASWQTQFPAGSATELAVVNSGQIDYTPPAVSSIGFTPSAVAAGDSPAQVLLTFELTDSRSGVAGGFVGFWRNYEEITVDFDTASRISGDASAGVYQVQLEIPRGTDSGNWELGIVVRDSAGNWSYRGAASYDPAPLPGGTLTTLTVSATSMNNLPVVEAGGNFTAFVGAALPFAGTFTDSDAGQTHTIEWDFGDGTTASGSLTPSHSFATAGDHVVTLTVTDSQGGSTSDTLTVTINEHLTYEEWAEQAFAPGTPASDMDDAADADGDGMPNWAEWAFNTGPQNANQKATTLPQTVKDQATGETCLIMSFNRRIGGAGVTYIVEVSDTLGGWDGTGTQVELVGSPVTNADGVTERVTVCVRSPAAVTEKFMRVSVQR